MIKTYVMKLLTKMKAVTKLYQDTGNNHATIFKEIFISSILLQLILEILSHRSIFKGILTITENPLMFICSVSLMSAFMSLALFLPKRHFGYLLVSTLWLWLGFTNFILLSFRTTPLTATDFKMLSSVVTIIGRYLNSIQMILVGIVAILVILVLIYIAFKIPRTKIRFKQSFFALFLSCLLLFTSYNVAFSANAVSRNFGNIANAFLDYGFAYSFTTSVVDSGIQEPKSYSKEKINHVLEALDTEPSPTLINIKKPTQWFPTFSTESKIVASPDLVTQERPNIILIQLESFFDVNRIKAFEYNQNPLPNMTNLMEHYSSGFLTVPSIGAGTANTEFEILSGMSLDYFGAGEYPYKTILKESTVESLPYILTDLGYHNHAIHNNMGTFYSRNSVYPNLGFDSFTSIEYMNNVIYNPLNWAKDIILVPEIIKALEASKEQDFIYTVSVQPHGKYPEEVIIENSTIIPTVVSSLPGMVNQDQDSFNSVEPTSQSETEIIVTEATTTNTSSETTTSSDINTTEVLPEVDESTYNKYLYYVNQIYETDAFVGSLIQELESYPEPVMVVFYGDHMPSLDIELEDLKSGGPFQIEYVIWDNMNLNKTNQDISAYQLTSLMMNKLGIETGILNKFHQTMMNSLEYEEELQLLQYDMLYGDKNVYGGQSPYLPKKLQMGIDTIVIKNIYQKGEAIFINGQNFTPWSEVFIDKNQADTIFIDEQNLIVPNIDLENGMSIFVSQVTETGKKLSSTDIYLIKNQ